MLAVKGSAPLAMLNLVTGVTAAAIAAGGLIATQADNVVFLPVSVGSLLQVLALFGLGVIWWSVRSAFTDLRNRVGKVEEQSGKMSDRLSYLEGVLDVSDGKRVQRSLGVRGRLVGEDQGGEAS